MASYNFISFKEPREIILSQHMKCKTTGGKQKLQLVKESFQYIPILETLKALLNHPDILAEVILSAPEP